MFESKFNIKLNRNLFDLQTNTKHQNMFYIKLIIPKPNLSMSEKSVKVEFMHARD